MRLIRIYAGPDGRSHFEDKELPFVPFPGPYTTRLATKPIPVKDFFLVRPNEPNTVSLPFHTAPGRYYILVLEGVVEFRVGDGDTRRLEEGDMCLAEDTTGEGHLTKGAADGLLLFLSLPD